MITFGSLFAGIGGMDLGLEMAGMKCLWQVEIDPYCQRVLAKHWPDVRRHGDIKTFHPVEQGFPYVDLICGGFPCQDISYAGKGAGLSGERSGLWFEYARVIRELRPRYVLVENVAALLVRGLDVVLGDLASLGYDAEWSCVSAQEMGLPHSRERVFVVAYRYGQRELQPQRLVGIKQRRFSDRREAIDWVLSSGGILRSHDGIPAQLDRVGGVGNSVVPQCAELIGRMILASQE